MGPAASRDVHSDPLDVARILTERSCVEPGMAFDPSRPFRGSLAVKWQHVSWAVLRGSRYVHLGYDTYVAAGVEIDQRTRIRAALVQAGEGAVATGWSSVWLHGLDVAPRVMPDEIAVPPERRPRTGQARSTRRRLPANEVVEVDGARATSPLRTAFDLATRPELDDAVVAADALGRLDGFSGADLASFAEHHPGVRGLRRVPAVAGLVDTRAESPPETRLRLMLVRSDLPAPVPQCAVANEFGWVFARVDLGWPTYRVAVEYDGKDHAQLDRRGRDLDRLEDLRREGWVVVVLTARQLRRPERVVERLREELLARGWVPGA